MFIGVADGLVIADIDAVEARNATRCIDHMVGHVYTLGLTVVLALAAVDAEVGVDIKMKQRIAAQDTKRRAYGADGVAQQPAAAI